MPSLQSLGAKAILAIVLVGLVAAILLWGPAACNAVMNANKRAEVAQRRGEAAFDSAAESANTVSNFQQNSQDVQASVREGTDAVREAPAGDSNDAADLGLCGVRPYSATERCARMRQAHSAPAS